MADSYICPTCDHEVIVGMSCVVCSKNTKPKRKTKQSKKAKSSRKPWEQDEIYDGLDLPDEDFDYDDFAEREFGIHNSNKSPHQKIGIAWYWWVTAIVLCVIWVRYMF